MINLCFTWALIESYGGQSKNEQQHFWWILLISVEEEKITHSQFSRWPKHDSLSCSLKQHSLFLSLSLSNNMLFLSFSFFLSLQLSLSKTLYVDTSFAAQSLGLHKTRSFFSSIFPSFWSLFLYLVHSLSPLLSHSFSLTNAFAFCEPFLHYTLYSFLSESLSPSIS